MVILIYRFMVGLRSVSVQTHLINIYTNNVKNSIEKIIKSIIGDFHISYHGGRGNFYL